MVDAPDQAHPTEPADDGAVRAYVWRHGVERAAERFGLTVREILRACDRAANRLTRSRMNRALRRSRVWD